MNQLRFDSQRGRHRFARDHSKVVLRHQPHN